MNYTLTILRQRLSGKIHENDILEICHATQGTDGNAAKLTLYRLLFDNNKRIAENAAWIFTHFDLHNNEWLYDKQNELINETLHTASNTKRRLLLTLLLRQPFPPENLRTDFLDFCFSQMLSPQTAISIKSLCMKLTYEQCKHFPELRTELRTTLEMMEPDFLPAGVRTSRKNLLKILQKKATDKIFTQIRTLQMMKLLLFIILYAFCTLSSQATHPLQEQIQQITANTDAHVGVALIIDGKDTITINNDDRYPLMSVMKYHQALAVAHYLDKHHLPLSTSVFIRKENLRPDTYSPLRDRYPEGNISLPISELLTYTLQLSDNNACDILFDYIGGTEETDKYLRTIECDQFAVTATEDDMHKNLALCYNNWSTPLSTARLMDRLAAETLPIDTLYTHFIRKTLLDCQTGKARLPFPLQGTETRIGHKTGTSDQNEQGEWIGINDAGFILLPNGKRYTLVVFVKHSKLSFEATERVIADISAVVFHTLH